MALFGSWLATKHGMTDPLLAMVDACEVTPAHRRSEMLGADSLIIDGGQVSGELRSDLTAADVTAGTLGVFAVAGRSGDAA